LHILIPCYTRIELETLVPVLRELPKEWAVTVVVDPQYEVLDLLDELYDRDISKIPIESVPSDVGKFLTENRVSAVVTAHDASLIGALFLLAARKIGIASVYVPHGPLSTVRGKIIALKLIAVHVKSILTYTARYVASGCLARAVRIWMKKFVSGRTIDRLWDVVCVAGPASKTLFIRSGIPEDAIVITGQPRYDSFVKRIPQENISVVEHLGLDKDAPVVAVATQPFVEDGLWTAAQRRRFLELVVPAVFRAGGQPLIKLHPREGGAEVYRSLLSKLTDTTVLIVKDEVDLATVLTACDALLTVRSTIGLEAMMMDVPVIVFEDEGETGKSDPLDYVQYGAAFGVYSEKDLAPTISAVLFDANTRAGLTEASKSYVYDHAYLQDGLAAVRVASVIASRVGG
jgi:hypothetical protein